MTPIDTTMKATRVPIETRSHRLDSGTKPASSATAIATTIVENTGVCVRGIDRANAFGMSPSRPIE